MEDELEKKKVRKTERDVGIQDHKVTVISSNFMSISLLQDKPVYKVRQIQRGDRVWWLNNETKELEEGTFIQGTHHIKVLNPCLVIRDQKSTGDASSLIISRYVLFTSTKSNSKEEATRINVALQMGKS